MADSQDPTPVIPPKPKPKPEPMPPPENPPPVETPPPVVVTYEKGKLYQLELAAIQPDPEQPRKFFDAQALAELHASIASHGVLQPILVRMGTDNSFIIVSGERRYQASKLAGLPTIPAIITDGEPAEISIIENLLRENLTAIEEAEAIERLRAGHDYGLGKPEGSALDTRHFREISELLAPFVSCQRPVAQMIAQNNLKLALTS